MLTTSNIRSTDVGWVIVAENPGRDGNRHIYEFTFSRTRSDAIKKYTRIWVNQNWKHHYYKGVRCVKASRTITTY